MSSGGLATGSDGQARCPWGLSPADYVTYHDQEWGQPVRDTVGLFERVTLEAFQSGLSWLIILRKRPAFRSAFAGFDPAVVAGYGPEQVAALLADPGIVWPTAAYALMQAAGLVDDHLAGCVARRTTTDPSDPGTSLDDGPPGVISEPPNAPHGRT